MRQGESSRSAQDARRACLRSEEDEWCCSAGLSPRPGPTAGQCKLCRHHLTVDQGVQLTAHRARQPPMCCSGEVSRRNLATRRGVRTDVEAGMTSRGRGMPSCTREAPTWPVATHRFHESH